ncbi:MAG: hypothetical protein J3K34DRAFT_510243 [Monoraphidium minutum]|nr:MAG: hypothetical protein J3K34DRAFT_510243 [Monoraphidium minutum]
MSTVAVDCEEAAFSEDQETFIPEDLALAALPHLALPRLCPALARLATSIGEGGAGARLLRPLAAAPHLSSLNLSVDFTSHPPEDVRAAAAALAALAALRALRLTFLGQGGEGGALPPAALPGLAALQTLQLDLQGLSRQGFDSMALGPCPAGLRTLRLQMAGDSGNTSRRLVRSAAPLFSLTSLTLDFGCLQELSLVSVLLDGATAAVFEHLTELKLSRCSLWHFYDEDDGFVIILRGCSGMGAHLWAINGMTSLEKLTVHGLDYSDCLDYCGSDEFEAGFASDAGGSSEDDTAEARVLEQERTLARTRLFLRLASRRAAAFASLDLSTRDALPVGDVLACIGASAGPRLRSLALCGEVPQSLDAAAGALRALPLFPELEELQIRLWGRLSEFTNDPSVPPLLAELLRALASPLPHLWRFKPPWVRILEEDADVDDEVADLLQGTGGDPELLRSKMEARLQQRELFQERSGSDEPPAILFREVDQFDLWVWLELASPLTTGEREMLSSALKSWFVIGKLGGYNSGNMQVYHNSAGDLSYLEYDNSELRGSSAGGGGLGAFMHELGEVEYAGAMARFRVDMGTADEVALDVLINLLVGFSRDVAGVTRVTFGGDELNGWARPEAAGGADANMPPKVGINPMRLPEGIDDDMDLLAELEILDGEIEASRGGGRGGAPAAPGPLGSARAGSGLGWSRKGSALAGRGGAAEAGPGPSSAAAGEQAAAAPPPLPPKQRAAAAPPGGRALGGDEGLSVYSEEDFKRSFPSRGGGE